MADITKCNQKLCPLAETCYRITAKDNEYWQSYTTFDYIITAHHGIVCEYYIQDHSIKPIKYSNKAE